MSFKGEFIKQSMDFDVLRALLDRTDGLTAAKAAALSALTEAEIARLDGAGTTIVASKAVIADADKDIVGARKLWLGANGAGGFAGELKLQNGADPGASATFVYADVIELQGNTGTIKAGAYTAIADDDTANTKSIATGLTSIAAFNVMILRAGVPIFSDQALSVSGGNIVVADGGATYVLTAGDVIHWIAVGAL